MKLPKMILFDYGQTLVNERRFDGVKGTQAAASSIDDELGRYNPSK